MRQVLWLAPGARPLIAAAVLGLASTLGDWIWVRFVPDGAIVPGVIHGIVIFALLAVVLGWAVRAPGASRRLLATLPAVGLLLAAIFYPLAHGIGYLGALLATWLAMWLALALLAAWARGGSWAPGAALVRGLAAGIASGLAFWLVSAMWTDPEFGAGYPVRFLLWTFAFLPGFLALLVGPSTTRAG